MSSDDLERRCRVSGLSSAGGHPAMVARLLALDAYLSGSSDAGSGAAPAAGGLLAVPPLTGVFAGNAAGANATTTAGADAARGSDGGDGGSAAAPAAAPAAVAASRWTTVDDANEGGSSQVWHAWRRCRPTRTGLWWRRGMAVAARSQAW
eukprot:97312-Chlamydomonas_euryale.AAC.2